VIAIVVVVLLSSDGDTVDEALLVPDGAHTIGAADAAVTVVEFSSFTCGACGVFATDAAPRIFAEYVNSGRVKFAYRHVAWDREAGMAAEAADCAGEQGRFKEFHDILFTNLLSKSRVPLSVENLESFASAVEIDPAAFSQCALNRKYASHVQSETEAAMEIGIEYTPTVYINGKPIVGAQAYDTYRERIEEELAKAE